MKKRKNGEIKQGRKRKKMIKTMEVRGRMKGKSERREKRKYEKGREKREGKKREKQVRAGNRIENK